VVLAICDWGVQWQGLLLLRMLKRAAANPPSFGAATIGKSAVLGSCFTNTAKRNCMKRTLFYSSHNCFGLIF
jgi:hypothetical protein